MVKFIDPVVQINLYMMQNLSHLCITQPAFFQNVFGWRVM